MFERGDKRRDVFDIERLIKKQLPVSHINTPPPPKGAFDVVDQPRDSRQYQHRGRPNKFSRPHRNSRPAPPQRGRFMNRRSSWR